MATRGAVQTDGPDLHRQGHTPPPGRSWLAHPGCMPLPATRKLYHWTLHWTLFDFDFDFDFEFDPIQNVYPHPKNKALPLATEMLSVWSFLSFTVRSAILQQTNKVLVYERRCGTQIYLHKKKT